MNFSFGSRCILFVVTFAVCSCICIIGSDRLNCASHSFALGNMTSCHPLLTCDDIKASKMLRRITYEGNVKDVYLMKWHGYNVALLKLKNKNFVNDFMYGLNLLMSLNNNSEYIVRLVGHCAESNTYVTEYHRLGDGRNILNALRSSAEHHTACDRIKLCLNYVNILDYLHNANPLGRFVFCDSNDLTKLLSQLLITNDLKLIMNDVDALTLSGADGKVLCGCRKLSGEFVAPEQRTTDHAHCHNYSKHNGYSEKTDIWKVPDVCNFFIGTHADFDLVKYHLFDIHKQCKNKNPEKRPHTGQIIQEYNRIIRSLSSDVIYEHYDL